MWDILERDLERSGIVEYGIFQRNRKPSAPIWRRHGNGGRRFDTLSNALFGSQGARKACKGSASYPKSQYSESPDTLIVPYVATWLQNRHHAFLIRASAGDPEVTIVPIAEVSELNPITEQRLCETLAAVFGRGATSFGVRLLGTRNIYDQ